MVVCDAKSEKRVPGSGRSYRTKIEAHRDLSEANSTALNALLVLLLANHIGDLEVIPAPIKLARQQLKT
jgi:hypothetical protein